nr:MAG TPA: hypothetical protein [Caudoviricetes sp.]
MGIQISPPPSNVNPRIKPEERRIDRNLFIAFRF